MLLHASLRCPAAAAAASPGRRRPAVAAAAKGRKGAGKAASSSGGPPPPAEVVVGIDLGTTNSAVARVVGGAPVCIPNADGDTLTPSVVAFLEDGSTLVGRDARGGPPATTFYSVKRIIGRRADDPVVEDEAARLPYEIVADEDGAAMLACAHVGPGAIYPEEASALVLARLLADAEVAAAATNADGDAGSTDNTAAGAPSSPPVSITKAVVSVPAYFDDAQREATVEAGRLAGLETVRLIKEPVAAALAYGLDLDEEQVVLVFDLGGGTLDVSLLEVGNGTVEVLSTGGDPHLGGDDWDAAIAAWLEAEHLKPAGVDARAPEVAANLKALAERAKIGLSEHESVVLRMPVGGPDGGPLRVELTRARFDALCEDLYRRARLPLDAACWQAGVDLNAALMGLQEKREDMARRGVPAWKQEMLKLEVRPRGRGAISRVLLVGGATRMPSARRFVEHMTGIAPEVAAIDPDEAVALGAAVQAGILQGEVSDLMVMDQWQASLMRTLAELQLRRSREARARVEGAFDMAAMDGGDDEGGGDEDGGGGDGAGDDADDADDEAAYGDVDDGGAAEGAPSASASGKAKKKGGKQRRRR